MGALASVPAFCTGFLRVITMHSMVITGASKNGEAIFVKIHRVQGVTPWWSQEATPLGTKSWWWVVFFLAILERVVVALFLRA